MDSNNDVHAPVNPSPADVQYAKMHPGMVADRVWAGTRWHYPHIEAMQAELTTLRQRAEAAERRVAELEGDARLGLRYTVGTEARTLFAMPDADAAKNFALELSSQLGQATWIRDHDAKAAIDAAGGQQ